MKLVWNMLLLLHTLSAHTDIFFDNTLTYKETLEEGMNDWGKLSLEWLSCSRFLLRSFDIFWDAKNRLQASHKSLISWTEDVLHLVCKCHKCFICCLIRDSTYVISLSLSQNQCVQLQHSCTLSLVIKPLFIVKGSISMKYENITATDDTCSLFNVLDLFVLCDADSSGTINCSLITYTNGIDRRTLFLATGLETDLYVVLRQRVSSTPMALLKSGTDCRWDKTGLDERASLHCSTTAWLSPSQSWNASRMSFSTEDSRRKALHTECLKLFGRGKFIALFRLCLSSGLPCKRLLHILANASDALLAPVPAAAWGWDSLMISVALSCRIEYSLVLVTESAIFLTNKVLSFGVKSVRSLWLILSVLSFKTSASLCETPSHSSDCFNRSLTCLISPATSMFLEIAWEWLMAAAATAHAH